jgi:hypothetical protein
MARTLIAALDTTPSGSEPTMTNVDASASPNGMYFPWTETARLMVVTAGTATAPTFDIPVLVAGQAVTDLVGAVQATTPVGKFFGPFPTAYRQADGNVYVNFSVATAAKACIID